MSRNFETYTDTQREYFNASYFNKSGTNQIAKYETTLLKPFFNDPDKWKLAINRFRVPLSAIPLTQNNIPFQQWEVGLSYKGTTTTTTQTNYVNQYNPLFVTTPTNYNLFSINTGTLQQTQYDDLTVNTGTVTLPNTSYYPFAYDLLTGTNGTIYNNTVASNTIINCLDMTTGAIITTLTVPSPLISMTCDIQTGDLYCVCLTSLNYFLRTSNTTWGAINTFNIPIDLSYNYCGFANGYFFCSSPSGQNFYTCFNKDVGPNAIYTINTTGVSPILYSMYNFKTSTYYIIIYTENTYIYTVGLGGVLTNISYINDGSTSRNLTPFGFNYQGLLVGVDLSDFNLTIDECDVLTGRIINTYPSPFNPETLSIFPSVSNSNTSVDSGNYNITTYQQYLNKINDAFLTAFNNIKTTLGSAFIPTEAPRIIYDPNTRLFSMLCEGLYLSLDSSGNNIYGILMNDTLWNKFYYPSTETTPLVGFHSILMQNNGLNAVVGNGSASLPQYIYVQQEASTIYSFFDLTRIIIGTFTIPVSGDGEGTTFSTGGGTSNNTINIITDILPDTTTLAPESCIIYIPNGILRWYNLYAQQPFSKIDLIFYYETKDSNIYPLEIIDGEYFSAKLEFKKGLGDF